MTAESPERAAALEIVGLSKTFVANRALFAVDVRIDAGEVHALLGENGSGKSTLIKVLSGYHRPDEGASVRIAGNELSFGSPQASYALGARFVHQDLGLIEASSISDNLAFGPGFPTRLRTVIDRRARARAREALEVMGLELDPRLPVAKLSPAQKTGVAVARALLPDNSAPARLLVLDEPTARLPEDEVEALLAMIRTVAARGIGIMYVSHRLDEIFRIADRATVLRDGHRVATEPVLGLTRQTLLEQLFAENLEKVHRRAEPIVADVEPALRVRGVCSESLHSVDFDVRPGEIVGVAGITGSGREALCATLFGARPRDEGTVEVRGRSLRGGRPDLAMAAGVAYVPAERKLLGCFIDLPARENISVSNLGAWRVRRRDETRMATRWFERLGVRPTGRVGAPMASFSGGNQQKIVYGKWFERRPRLFLLDEPTQGVDVGAKAELHRALFEAAEAGAGVLVTSTDVDELVTVADRVIVLRSGTVVAELSGAQVTVHAVTAATLDIEKSTNEGTPGR